MHSVTFALPRAAIRSRDFGLRCPLRKLPLHPTIASQHSNRLQLRALRHAFRLQRPLAHTTRRPLPPASGANAANMSPP